MKTEQSIRVNLRKSPRGDSVLCYHEATEDAHAERERFILLIHGFNRTRGEAEDSFHEFENQMGNLAPEIAKDICEVYWPADAWIPGLRGAFYPWLVKRAKLCSGELANYMERRNGPNGTKCQFIVVAHSLGCRLILETLDELVARSPADLKGRILIFLMAAAVPVNLVTASDGLRPAVDFTPRSYVLYSECDRDLRRLFRLGQSLAPGEKGLFPEAVGLKGNPSDGLWSERAEMARYDHGNYWKGEKVIKFIAYSLGSSVAKPILDRAGPCARHTADRPDPLARPSIERRRLTTRK